MWKYPDKSIGVLYHTGKNDFKHIDYYNDWSELMPVVEKIEETNIVQIFFLECQIYKHQGTIGPHNEVIVWLTGEKKQEAVFKAVVDYIKILNQQK